MHGSFDSNASLAVSFEFRRADVSRFRVDRRQRWIHRRSARCRRANFRSSPPLGAAAASRCSGFNRGRPELGGTPFLPFLGVHVREPIVSVIMPVCNVAPLKRGTALLPACVLLSSFHHRHGLWLNTAAAYRT